MFASGQIGLAESTLVHRVAALCLLALVLVSGCAQPKEPPAPLAPPAPQELSLQSFDYVCPDGAQPSSAGVCSLAIGGPGQVTLVLDTAISDNGTIAMAVYEDAPSNAQRYGPWGLVYSSRSHILLSRDQGHTWNRVELPDLPTPSFLAGQTTSNYLTGLAWRGHELWLTGNLRGTSTGNFLVTNVLSSGGDQALEYLIMTPDLGASWRQPIFHTVDSGALQRASLAVTSGGIVWAYANQTGPMGLWWSSDGATWESPANVQTCFVMTSLVEREGSTFFGCEREDGLAYFRLGRDLGVEALGLSQHAQEGTIEVNPMLCLWGARGLASGFNANSKGTLAVSQDDGLTWDAVELASRSRLMQGFGTEVSQIRGIDGDMAGNLHVVVRYGHYDGAVGPYISQTAHLVLDRQMRMVNESLLSQDAKEAVPLHPDQGLSADVGDGLAIKGAAGVLGFTDGPMVRYTAAKLDFRPA